MPLPVAPAQILRNIKRSLRNRSNNIFLGGENIERESDVRNSGVVLDPDLLLDFASCKYKAAQRISFQPCQNIHSEMEAIQKHQQVRLKERWQSTITEGYEVFNGTFSSFAEFRMLSMSVFGNIKLTYNKLQCDVDGIEKSICADGQRYNYSPLLISLSNQPSVLERKTLALASIIIGKLVGVVPCVFRTNPASIPIRIRPPFRRESGQHSGSIAATIPEQSGQCKMRV